MNMQRGFCITSNPSWLALAPNSNALPIKLCAVTKVGFQDLEVELVEGGDTYINLTFDRTLEKPILVSYSLTDIADSGEATTLLCNHT